MKDLVVLVPDKNTEVALRSLLSTRWESLGIRQVEFDIFTHPQRDPGVYQRAAEFLRNFQNKYRYALVVFDLEGCGAEGSRAEVQEKVKDSLGAAGWRGRSAVVVIDPELEVWVFSESPHVIHVLADGDSQAFWDVAPIRR